MTTLRGDELLATLRARAEALVGEVDHSSFDQLGHALHELDVHQAELRLQNQTLQDAQAALALSRDRYEAMFRASPVPLAVSDIEGVLVDVNDRLTELLVTPRQYLLGKPLVVYLPAGNAEAFHTHRRAALTSPGPQRIELALRTLHGETRDALIESCAFSDPDQPTSQRLLTAFIDVTEQRAAETARQELEVRVRESEKMESIGRISAGIAHDVNNLLTVVMSTATLAIDTLGSSSAPLHDELVAILDTCGRGARLMRGLLGLARPPAPGNHRVDVGELLARVAKLERRPNVQIDVIAPTTNPVFAHGDEDQLVQVLVNLCGNGIDAMNGVGTLTLACGRGDSRDCWISVTDRGTGMPLEVRDRIFEPLFTTKAMSGGSGLGLAIVQKLVHAHGGRIEVETHVGTGTTMRVILPCATVTDQPPPVLVPPASVSDELGRTFMLVEDNDAVRAIAARVLRSSKGKVEQFARADLALAAVREGLRFDVALLDVDMPIMTGPELAQALIALQPAVPIVFITGAEGDTIPDAIKERPQTRVLRKPWTKAELATLLAELTPGPRSTDLRL